LRALPVDMCGKHGGTPVASGGAVLVPADLGLVEDFELAVVLQTDAADRIQRDINRVDLEADRLDPRSGDRRRRLGRIGCCGARPFGDAWIHQLAVDRFRFSVGRSGCEDGWHRRWRDRGNNVVGKKNRFAAPGGADAGECQQTRTHEGDNSDHRESSSFARIGLRTISHRFHDNQRRYSALGFSSWSSGDGWSSHRHRQRGAQQRQRTVPPSYSTNSTHRRCSQRSAAACRRRLLRPEGRRRPP
jgi:hypothetical protein